MAELDAATQLISDIGKQLAAHKTCPKKDYLVKVLKQAATALPELKQLALLKPSIKPLSDSLVKHRLFQHKDKDIRLLVAICFCEIIRILAPNPDFSDTVFKDIFKLFLGIFLELADTSSPFLSRRVTLLETVAKLEFCVLMLDTGCEDLVIEMFRTFFSVVREHHPQTLVSSMLSIMALILKEKVSDPLLDVIFQYLLKEAKGVSSASSQLAVSVIQNCSEELEPSICRFLTSCILNRDATKSELKEFYHEIIFKIFECAPHMLLTVIPNLTQELLTDQVDVRIKAINLIGRLFMLPGHRIAQEYRHLFIEFLNRFSDKSAEVRLSALSCAKAFYMVNPSGTESLEVLTALEGRLLDFDDKVRTQAVTVVCDLVRSNLKSVPTELISRVAERLRDKKVSVRKKALQKVLEIYKDYCIKCSGGTMTLSEYFEQILCRILMLCYDKDCKEFRPQNMELVLAEDLFPASLSIEERTRHWIFLFSLLTPPHVKALNIILSQKRRLQTEMQVYLALRTREELNDSEEVEKRIKASFVKMSASFPDPANAEECFHKLNVMEDNGIFHALVQLLDEVTFEDAQTTRDNFLRKIGDKHPLFGFLRLLSTKCMFNIFSSEHVRCILDHLSSVRSENKHLKDSCVKLLLALISAFPLLTRGSESQFRLLFLEEDISFGEELIQILAKAGPYISITLGDVYSSLERVCLEGTRVQSKLAVSAIAALSCTSEQFIFSELCKKLVDSLHSAQNIPTVLQSLGCIAQHSVSTFEAQEEEITSYIVEKIFRVSEVDMSDDMGSFDETSECSVTCKLKIFGLKAIVKSFLPHQRIHVNRQINTLLNILLQMLRKGDVSDSSISGESDKAHFRLAAAKSVLLLSRRWDLHISPQIFCFTILMAKDPSPLVCRLFVNKIHKLLKEHTIPIRYACAFALASSDSPKDLKDDSLKYMAEFIREYSKEARVHKTSAMQRGVTDCPVYIVVFLVYLLAHDASFPSQGTQDEEIYAKFCSPLLFTLQALANASFVDGDMNVVNRAVSYLRSIFHAIKKAEDAIDAQMTPKLHILADFGISVLNTLNDISTSNIHGLILLPSALYKINHTERKEGNLNSSTQCGLDQNITRVRRNEALPYCPPGSVELHNEFSIGDEHERIASGNSESIILSDQVPSSCDSLSRKPSLPEKEGSSNSAALKENDTIIKCNSTTTEPSECLRAVDMDLCNSKVTGYKSEVLIGRRIKLRSPIDNFYYCGTVDSFDRRSGTHKILCDNGNLEVVSLECETWEAIGDDFLLNQDSGGLHSEKCDHVEHSPLSGQTEMVDAFGDDASLRENLLKKENRKFLNRKIPLAGTMKKKKRERVSVDTSVSEVIDVNKNAIAQRTRRRQKVDLRCVGS